MGTISAVAGAGAQDAASLSVPKIVSPALAARMVTILTEVQPVCAALSTPADISTVLEPAAVAEVQKYVPDPTEQAAAKMAIDTALSLAQSELTSHPDIAAKTGGVAQVANAVIAGAIAGFKSKACAQ